MDLLSLILIAMGIIVGVCVFYVAWEMTSSPWGPGDRLKQQEKKEPGESKESNNSPGS